MVHIHVVAAELAEGRELARQLGEDWPEMEILVQQREADPHCDCRAVLSLGCGAATIGGVAAVIVVRPASGCGQWVWSVDQEKSVSGQGDARELHRAVEAAVLKSQLSRFCSEAPMRDLTAVALRSRLTELVLPIVPTASVTARAKTADSFAEKVVRRSAHFADPVTAFHDLVGARVIVSTTRQIDAVGAVVRDAFDVQEDDDKTIKLSEGQFGYRGLHLGVRFQDMIVEIQIRTAMQHAWADIVHDRLYKSPVPPSHDEKRVASVLAAVLEQGDRLAQQLSDSIDERARRFSRIQTRSEVAAEIDRLILIVSTAPNDLARRVALAHLQADYGEIRTAVNTLLPVREAKADRGLIWLGAISDLGHYLVEANWSHPGNGEYQLGKDLLDTARARFDELDAAIYGSGLRVLQARNLSRLAWAVAGTDPGGRQGQPVRAKARELMAHAHLVEPQDSYLLADALAMSCADQGYRGLDDVYRDRIHNAREDCAGHARAGLQMPRSAFAAGRFSLLLGDRLAALGWYARALSHVADGQHCVGFQPIRRELEWVSRMVGWDLGQRDLKWVQSLLELAERCRGQAGSGLFIVGDDLPLESEIACRKLKRCPQVVEGYYSAETIGDAVAEWVVANEDAARAVPGLGAFFFGTEFSCPVHARLALSFGLRVLVESSLAAPVAECTAVVDRAIGELPRLTAVPRDPAIRSQTLAMAAGASERRPAEWVEAMAEQIHELYVRAELTRARARLGASARTWAELPDEFRRSSADQARQIGQSLVRCGLMLAATDDARPSAFLDDQVIEKLAEIEHGRWSADKIARGYRWGKEKRGRDHPDLVAWEFLAESSRERDRDAVRGWPKILDLVGLRIVKA